MTPKNLDPIPLEDLLNAAELAGVNQHLNIHALRWQLRFRHSNGLDSACVRIGKKLLISKSRYERWLATRTEEAAA